ncbi:hypothetical protein KEM48_005287 [Puccinia striiformis f. sp. tritici PST-130]|nr:hypothetical protein KEM48_005287 [Puccinia striiformis f. sp. tritici PST-130]
MTRGNRSGIWEAAEAAGKSQIPECLQRAKRDVGVVHEAGSPPKQRTRTPSNVMERSRTFTTRRGNPNHSNCKPPKANPPRKARTTRATTTKQGKTPNATGLPGSEQSNPIPPTDVTAALDAENRTETGIHDDLIDGDKDDDDTPQIISVRNNPQDAATEQARRAKLALDKAVKAEDDGNEERADFFYAIYHSLLRRSPNRTEQPHSDPPKPSTSTPSTAIQN